LIAAGWVNREQQQVIEYLRTENQVLKEKLGKKRILLNDDQRRRLAVKGKVLGRKLLGEIGTLFTADTILRWHRRLIAEKWDYSERRKKVGRPPTEKEVIEFVLRFANENPTWGYDRIAGELEKLGHAISDQTVGNILKANGIEPERDRKRSMDWSTFLKAHWDVLTAIDFTTVEVWTKGGLVTFYLLFLMELKTRRVHFGGYTTSPNEAWMKQTARNLTDCYDGFLCDKKILLMDRDGAFCQSFRKMLNDSGCKPKRLPARSPNLNAYMERFFGSLKRECLNKLILFGERSLRNAVKNYLDHYHEERPHQGLHNNLIIPLEKPPDVTAKIESTERLGGLLRSYHRAA